jgi:hypothetical protein
MNSARIHGGQYLEKGDWCGILLILEQLEEAVQKMYKPKAVLPMDYVNCSIDKLHKYANTGCAA